jgi:hypothetical protein
MIVVNLADRVGLSRETLKAMTREVSHLWKAAGVDIQWVLNPNAPGRDQADVYGECEQPVTLWVFVMGDDEGSLVERVLLVRVVLPPFCSETESQHP